MNASWKIGGAIAATTVLAVASWAIWTSRTKGDGEPTSRLPGEFERTGALVLSGRGSVNQAAALATMAAMVRAVDGKTLIVVLVQHPSEQRNVENMLAKLNVDVDAVHFLKTRHDSLRLRHFGPLWISRPEAGPALVDTLHHASEPRDGGEAVFSLAKQFELPIVRAEFFLGGGNLLTNGRGLAITTGRIIDQNAKLGLDDHVIDEMLRRTCGIRETVFLQALHGEPTGNVEMFATFPSHDTVLIGEYDSNLDSINAERLNSNAKRLSEIEYEPGKKLNVVRIPMPPRIRDIWRSYTTVVYVNGVLLMPFYPGIDGHGAVVARETYRKVLPKEWKIVRINAQLIEAESGTLRSLTMRLGPLNKTPDFPPLSWKEEDTIQEAAQ